MAEELKKNKLNISQHDQLTRARGFGATVSVLLKHQISGKTLELESDPQKGKTRSKKITIGPLVKSYNEMLSTIEERSLSKSEIQGAVWGLFDRCPEIKEDDSENCHFILTSAAIRKYHRNVSYIKVKQGEEGAFVV